MASKILAMALTYNGGRFLRPLVESLRRAPCPEIDIAIIDNGSTCEDTRRILDQLQAQGLATVIRHTQNHRFAIGYNLALEPILAAGRYPYLFIVNDDVEVEPDCAGLLLRYLQDHPDVFCVGPTVTWVSNRRMVVSVGNQVSRLNARPRDLLSGKDIDEVKHLEPRECDYVSGCAMLIDAEKLRRVGLFDAAIYHYFEDTDLCCRAQAMGYKVVALPQAVVGHHGGGSHAHLLEGEVFYYFNRNRWFFLKRHGLRGLYWFTYFWTPRLLWRVAREPQVRRLYLQALRDAWRGRGGPYVAAPSR